MPAYVVAGNHVTDAEIMGEYASLVPATLEPFGGKFVVRGTNSTMRFNTLEEAQNMAQRLSAPGQAGAAAQPEAAMGGGTPADAETAAAQAELTARGIPQVGGGSPVERLVELVRQAAQPPQIRRKTRPTLGSKIRRLETKRHHAGTKNLRRSSPEESGG